jgi:dTDP-4-amino-4,6-dideoxygalactose transaminase
MLDRAMTALGGLLLPGGRSESAETAYQRALEEFFGEGRAFAFWKGRIALYAMLRALGIGPGDEVIVPGYTCVMVPGPVLYVGAKPVYVDIDPNRYNARPEEVRAKITSRTRAILIQHTYGLPAFANEIAAIAAEQNIPILEDCCHTFGARLNGRLLGTFGVGAFFSGQWNKPFSTGLGGVALIRDASLAEGVARERSAYALPSRKAAFMLAAQLLVYELFIRPSTTALATRMFRTLTKKGVVVGSSSNAEFEPVMPDNYTLRALALQCRLGRQEVRRAAANMAHRRHAGERYAAELPRLGYTIPALPPGFDGAYLRFPLRVANKEEALARAAEFGVEIGSWFEVPLHPKETDQPKFGYQPGACPVAERASNEVINLPTHRRVSERDIERTMRFIENVCRPADRSGDQ